MQIRQSYSSWITDCQHDFEKGKHLQNTFKQTLKFPSSVYDWAIPEKKKKTNGGWGHAFLKKPLEVLGFLLLEIPDETKFHPLETPQNCITPLKA